MRFGNPIVTSGTEPAVCQCTRFGLSRSFPSSTGSKLWRMRLGTNELFERVRAACILCTLAACALYIPHKE